VSLESLRGRISVVPQDTSLFDETVEYNLRYEKEKEEEGMYVGLTVLRLF
jgi:ABC-type multidrug transport system fused ATPase/permease subunit